MERREAPGAALRHPLAGYRPAAHTVIPCRQGSPFGVRAANDPGAAPRPHCRRPHLVPSSNVAIDDALDEQGA